MDRWIDLRQELCYTNKKLKGDFIMVGIMKHMLIQNENNNNNTLILAYNFMTGFFCYEKTSA